MIGIFLNIFLISLSTLFLIIAGVFADRIYEDHIPECIKSKKIIITLFLLMIAVISQGIYLVKEQEQSDETIRTTKNDIMLAVSSTSEAIFKNQQYLNIGIGMQINELNKLESELRVITGQVKGVKSKVDDLWIQARKDVRREKFESF